MKILNPYADLRGGAWLRGNLHAHTTRSDGRMSPQEVIDVYASQKYDFLMISDHDVLTSAEWLSRCESRNMVLIPGNEITAHGSDILHVGASSRIPPDQPQAVLEAIVSGDGLAIMAHPSIGRDFNHCSVGRLQQWRGYLGIEIVNGAARHTHGSSEAVDKWEQLLASGRRVWGFANDDSHEEYQVGLAWNVVYVHERSLQGIHAALVTGRFYASTGVVIRNISVEGRRIRLETENAHHIAAIREAGVRFCQAHDSFLEAQVQDSSRYVRFECWGIGEQKAWTQPFFIDHT